MTVEQLVPLIDFDLFLNGTKSEKLKVSQQVLSAFQNVGFIYLRGHGIPQSTVDLAFEWSKRFFQLSQEEKEKLRWTVPESNRGYVSMGREKTSTSVDKAAVELEREFPDLKESMEIGKEPSYSYPNNWPAKGILDGFHEFEMEFFKICHLLHLKVMDCIGLGYGLEDGYFQNFCDKMDHTLRLLHYPSVPKSILDRAEQARTGAHTDYGSLTLLFQDDRGGLEVRDKNGNFVPAPPILGTIVVNAGDLLARWTNDSIKSTEHRVVSPPVDLAGENYPPRYSIPFFCNPNADALIECLDCCQNTQTPAKYAPILSGDHLVERLATTYQ